MISSFFNKAVLALVWVRLCVRVCVWFVSIVLPILNAILRLVTALTSALVCSFFFVSLMTKRVPDPRPYPRPSFGIWRSFGIWKEKHSLFSLKMELIKIFLLTWALWDDLHLRDEALVLWLAVVVAASDSSPGLAELMWFPSSLISAVYCIRRKGQQIDLISE